MRLARRKLPVVLINAGIERLPFPSVVCDDASAIEQSLEHLRALGHERIGLVLGPRDQPLPLPLGQSRLALVLTVPDDARTGGTIDLVRRDDARRIVGGIAVRLVVEDE